MKDNASGDSARLRNAANQEPVPDSGSAHPVADLISRARAGSSESLGELLEQKRLYLLRIANAELAGDMRRKGGASDLVQETFTRAQTGFDRFQGKTEPELMMWLQKIMRNQLLNLERDFRHTKKRAIEREVAGTSGVNRLAGAGHSIATPSREHIRNEEAAELSGAMAGLAENYKQVLKLRHWEQLTFEEIGSRTGRSADAARKLWARAVEQLRKSMEHQ